MIIEFSVNELPNEFENFTRWWTVQCPYNISSTKEKGKPVTTTNTFMLNLISFLIYMQEGAENAVLFDSCAFCWYILCAVQEH